MIGAAFMCILGTAIYIKECIMRTAWNRKSLMGKVYGRLMVVGEAESRMESSGKRLYWPCKCECGNETVVSGVHLVSGHTQSCGCLRDEKIQQQGILNRGRQYVNDEDKEQNAWMAHYRHFLSQARVRGIDTFLTLDDVKHLGAQHCFFCGAKPEEKKNVSNLRYSRGKFYASGIDRVDTTQPYTLENCVPCCYNCNREKGYITPAMVKILYHKYVEMGVL